MLIYSDMSAWELQQHLRLVLDEINRRQMDDIERLGAMIHRYANRNDSEVPHDAAPRE